MWQYPVVAETQLLRDEYASQFNYDIDAIFEYLMAKQAKHPERVVSFLPREPLDSNKLIKIMQSTAIDNRN
jgi:hypothetical protein